MKRPVCYVCGGDVSAIYDMTLGVRSCVYCPEAIREMRVLG